MCSRPGFPFSVTNYHSDTHTDVKRDSGDKSCTPHYLLLTYDTGVGMCILTFKSKHVFRKKFIYRMANAGELH